MRYAFERKLHFLFIEEQVSKTWDSFCLKVFKKFKNNASHDMNRLIKNMGAEFENQIFSFCCTVPVGVKSTRKMYSSESFVTWTKNYLN